MYRFPKTANNDETHTFGFVIFVLLNMNVRFLIYKKIIFTWIFLWKNQNHVFRETFKKIKNFIKTKETQIFIFMKLKIIPIKMYHTIKIKNQHFKWSEYDLLNKNVFLLCSNSFI